MKTTLYESYLNCSGSKYLKHLRKRQCKSVPVQEMQEPTWKLLLSICDKFEYTLETLALGIYIFACTHKKHGKD